MVLSKLPSLSLPMMAIFCRRDFNLAALKTFYDGKNMPPVILGNSEGWGSNEKDSVQGRSKKVFLKVLQYTQENT